MNYYVMYETMTDDISLITDETILMYVDGDPYYMIRRELARIKPRAKLLSYEVDDVMDDFRGY